MKTWRYLWRLICYRPGLYLLLFCFELLFFGVGPQLTGLVMRAFFDSLTGAAPAGLGIETLILLVLIVACARVAATFGDVATYFVFRYAIAALLRRNLFAHILDRPGVQAVPGSTGEAISRLRDDVDEIAFFMAESLIQFGFAFFALAAVVVMLRVDVRITLAVFLPLSVVVLVTNLATKHVYRYRQANRQAAGEVASFVGELFGAAQAVQVATAEKRLIARFRALNDTRRRAALRDRLFSELLDSVFGNAANLGTALILLLVGQAMQAGSFTVGDFALFVYYLRRVADLPGAIGMKWAWYKQIGVSFERLNALLPDAPPQALVAHNPVYLHGPLSDLPCPPRTAEHDLHELTASGLSYTYPDTGRGIRGIDLHLRRGSLTVVTGRVGSGKTTLLRVLLGLLPRDGGEIRWNGEPVADPAAFLAPPRCAYTPQVPLLFSETLRDNILMGLPEDKVDLPGALRLAVLEQDLAALPQGLDTLLGAKGVRLSGGQRQRAAAARMFVRAPALLVFDDLSSALDVETERILWERLFACVGVGGSRTAPTDAAPAPTCLVVSHRRAVLRQAEQIVVLKDGRVEGTGRLEDLLASCAEMQSLWRGESE